MDWICADDDPCGFFHYEDRMDAGEDFADIYPDVVREHGKEVAQVFRYYIEHYGDALPRNAAGDGAAVGRPERRRIPGVGADQLVA